MSDQKFKHSLHRFKNEYPEIRTKVNLRPRPSRTQYEPAEMAESVTPYEEREVKIHMNTTIKKTKFIGGWLMLPAFACGYLFREILGIFVGCSQIFHG